MNTKQTRSLGDISAVGVHRRDDVLAFERFYRLLKRDAVSNQFTNDLR